MNEQRWGEIRRLFQEAISIPLEERRAFLKAAEKDDPELADEVRDLLAFHEDPSTLVPDASLAPRPLEPPLDGRIDRYELLEVVGRGGMGTVYRARRADGSFEGEVAIKLLHGELASRDFQELFRRERQILANLRHPYIARMVDGGADPEGQPFLVMDFVEGEPLDAYCDRRRLTPRERIRLFQKVCQAVEFAHQNLVVHRDLKPGNILVTEEGEPRLLDFGIAKLLAPGSRDPTVFGSDSGVTPLTPDFASP